MRRASFTAACVWGQQGPAVNAVLMDHDCASVSKPKTPRRAARLRPASSSIRSMAFACLVACAHAPTTPAEDCLTITANVPNNQYKDATDILGACIVVTPAVTSLGASAFENSNLQYATVEYDGDSSLTLGDDVFGSQTMVLIRTCLSGDGACKNGNANDPGTCDCTTRTLVLAAGDTMGATAITHLAKGASCLAVSGDVEESAYRDDGTDPPTDNLHHLVPGDCATISDASGEQSVGARAFQGSNMRTFTVEYSESALALGQFSFGDLWGPPSPPGSPLYGLTLIKKCQYGSGTDGGQNRCSECSGSFCTGVNSCSCATRQLTGTFAGSKSAFVNTVVAVEAADGPPYPSPPPPSPPPSPTPSTSRRCL